MNSTKMYLILVVLFLRLVKSSPGNSSLTFVIDDSGSMDKEIDQVSKGARGIMDIVINYKSSQIKDIVLVTFNDPVYLNKMLIKSRDPAKIQEALDSIEAYNFQNKDWEEYSLSGIELALQNSQPNSYLFVFTDASAKDYDKVELIKSMCQKAQTQIVFILTDYCTDSNDRMCIVYHEIALACAGQVFIVEKDEIHKVIEYIKEIIKGDKSILKVIGIPAHQKTKIQFEIDDKIEYALLSAAGENVRVTALEGPSHNYIDVLTTNNNKVLRLNNPAAGTYWVSIEGTSQVILQVFGRTDFTLEHGFSELIPSSLSETSKQPISGRQCYLTVSITDTYHEVQIDYAQLWDMDQNFLRNLTLKKTSEGLYTTQERFDSPNKLFQISVTGKFIKTGRKIQRFAKTPIEPQKPELIPVEDLVPVTSITEGSQVEVAYNDKLQLSCMVSAYPAPSIRWIDGNGKVLPSKSYPVELPYKYISYLILDNVRTSDMNYSCYASNKLSGKQSGIFVKVKSPFVVDVAPPTHSTARYGKEAVLKCKITSSSRMSIYWYRTVNNTKVPISTSDKYTISSDGSELKIKSVTLESAGQYSSKAVLVDDPSQHIEYTTDVAVTIDDKAPITIITEGPEVQVSYSSKLKLTCKVSAYPAPNISWIDSNGKILPSKSYAVELPYRYTSDLIVDDVRTTDISYSCYASNKISGSHSTTKVKVTSTFVVKEAPPTHSTARYGKEAVIKCKITSSSRMSIDWYRTVNNTKVPISTSDKYIILSDGSELRIKSVTLESAGQYTSKAVLVDDPSQHIEYTTDVAVTIDDKAPITIITEGPEVQVSYNSKLKLTCKVSAYPAPNISWIDSHGKVLPSKLCSGEDPYMYRSKLTIEAVTKEAVYVCSAINALSRSRSKVAVTVLYPIIVEEPPTANNIVDEALVMDIKEVTYAQVAAKDMPHPSMAWYLVPQAAWSRENIKHEILSTEELYEQKSTIHKVQYSISKTSTKTVRNVNKLNFIDDKPKQGSGAQYIAVQRCEGDSKIGVWGRGSTYEIANNCCGNQ